MDKSGKHKKEAKDERIKDQRAEEQVMKSLDEAQTLEEKFQLLMRKHVDGERETQRLKQEIKEQEKQRQNVLREKENLQREYNKNVLMRDKLQDVCREQQKLLKSVKNESMLRIREEEERRKESQMKFQISLNEITQSLSKNNEENLKLRGVNLEMTKKLKFLAEQIQTREEHVEKMNEQLTLETKLHQAKLNKVQVESALQKEILIKEKQLALDKLKATQDTLNELSAREALLKEQVEMYTAKYDDFQSSLQKSNDIFSSYKVEIGKLSKNTKKLEKECIEWKLKWEKSNARLIQLATEKQARDEHAMRCNKQVEQLQRLLRALQNERTYLYQVLRENNILAPKVPVLPPEPEPMKIEPITNLGERDKMEEMTKNCAELKETLAHLQHQMKMLTVKPAETETKQQKQPREDEQLKKRTKRKQKSKTGKNVTEVKTTETATATATETATACVSEIAQHEILENSGNTNANATNSNGTEINGSNSSINEINGGTPNEADVTVVNGNVVSENDPNNYSLANETVVAEVVAEEVNVSSQEQVESAEESTQLQKEVLPLPLPTQLEVTNENASADITESTPN